MTLKVHHLPPAPAPTRDCRPRSVPVSAPHNFADAQKGISRPRWRSGEWTSEEDAELRRLASLGMSCNCIGRKMNRQPGSVYQRMKKLKIETAQKRFDHRKAYAEINKSESWRMKNTEGKSILWDPVLLKRGENMDKKIIETLSFLARMIIRQVNKDDIHVPDMDRLMRISDGIAFKDEQEENRAVLDMNGSLRRIPVLIDGTVYYAYASSITQKKISSIAGRDLFETKIELTAPYVPFISR